MKKTLKEILERKAEIRSLLQGTEDVDLDALQAELNELNERESEIRTREELAKQINVGKVQARAVAKPTQALAENDAYDTMEYRKAFMRYVLTGNEAELRTNQNTATTDVGAVIPTTVINRIVMRIEKIGDIYNRVTRTAYKGGVSIPVVNVKPTATWVTEGKGSDKQKVSTAAVTFAYHKLRVAVSVTLEVDTMAISAFEDMLVRCVADAMIKAIEQAIISGDGSGKPKGILAETPVEGQSVESVKLTFESIVEAESALPVEYESEAVWVMAKKTFGELLNERDAQKQPIARVNFGIDGKVERMLLGRPVILTNYIETSAKASVGKPIAFLFNMADYALNTNYGLTIKRYEDNDTDDQVTKAVMLVDGKVVDKNSLVVIKKKSG